MSGGKDHKLTPNLVFEGGYHSLLDTLNPPILGNTRHTQHFITSANHVVPTAIPQRNFRTLGLPNQPSKLSHTIIHPY
jgi:hypothetical protein